MKDDQVESVVSRLSPDSPVICIRPEVIENTARNLVSMFPGQVLYAVKCNPHSIVLKSLFKGGITHFDTASINEVKIVSDLFGVKVNCHFNHPVKARSSIKEASANYGINKFVVDTEDEIEKIKENSINKKLNISVRICTPPGKAIQHMSSKFGASLSETSRLIEIIGSLGYSAGIAFHVGSQCRDPDDYYRAIKLVSLIRNSTKVDISSINVGGGFPVSYVNDSVPPLESFVERICKGINDFDFENSILQCEPGRSLVANGCSILTQVHLRKNQSLYINDGIFGNLCELVHLKLKVPLRVFRGNSQLYGKSEKFNIYGPTCDPVDILPSTWALPQSIEEGDWIEFGQVGAYSSAINTDFNGFSTRTFVVVNEHPFWINSIEENNFAAIKIA